MSSKLGLILSLIFVALFFAFGVDLLAVQNGYTNLMYTANDIAYTIAKNGKLDEALILGFKKQFKVDFECVSNCAGAKGELVVFIISKDVEVALISNRPITLSIKRSAIFGYYD